MPTGPQITLIGNCQVTPLSTLLKTIYQVETIKLISAHLVQDKDAEHVSSIIDQAHIAITQHIHDLLSKQSTNRLFHTFNHPGKTLLTRLAKRIGKALGLTPKSNFKRELQGISDTLNRIQIPIHPFTQHNLGLKFSSTEHIQSDHINGVILKQPQQFTLLELIQQFSLFYSSHPALMRDIKD